jgi:hypothetical protein
MKFVIIFALFLLPPLLAQWDTALEQELVQDIDDYQLDEFSLTEAAFILSGANQPDSLDKYIAWYDELLQTLRDYNLDLHDRIASASKVFSYLHGAWLLTYKEEATTLLSVVNEKRYNCVAGTILYNLICADLGWPTEAFETPTHTYTIFPDFGDDITVENTSPIGFNIMRSLRDYSRYLLQYYPQSEALQIGLDRIYAYENSKGRKINNTELLGLLAYNRAYFADKAGHFRQAYDFVLLAQKFNRDSRSNVNFEIGLYYRWGKQLVEQQDYQSAFHLFADASGRYWENSDFSKNCKYAFQLAQKNNWQNKEWASFQSLTDEMLALELLDDKELESLKAYMFNWIQFYQAQKTPEQTRAMTHYWKDIFPDDSFLNSLP